MAESNIYTGLWLDYSRIVFFQPTLTLPSNWGQALLAITTIIIQLTGAAVWIIAAFTLHHRQASESVKDELDAQVAVILRNSDAITALIEFCNLGRRWRGAAPRARRRMFSNLAAPALITLTFTVASVLASQVVYDPVSAHALLLPHSCGSWFASSATSGPVSSNSMLATELRIDIASKAYVKSCYREDATGGMCSGLARNRISYVEADDAKCPTGADTCALGDRKALTLLSWIDSHHDLGINAKPSDRIQAGYKMTCAPLKQEVLQAILWKNHPVIFNNETYNETWYRIASDGSLDMVVRPYLAEKYGIVSTSFMSGLYPDQYPPKYAPFDAMSAFATLIYVLSNATYFTSASNDPVFGTTEQPTYGNLFETRLKISPVICTTSATFCNPTNSKCTGWGNHKLPLKAGAAGRRNMTESLQLSPRQNATLGRMATSFEKSNMPQVLKTMPQIRAMESYYIGSGGNLGLRDDQWKYEVRYWFHFVLARLQIVTQNQVGNIVLPTVPEARDEDVQTEPIEFPTEKHQLALCYAQKMLLPKGYQNFSALGLLVIFLLGVIVILAAAFLRLGSHKLPLHGPGQRCHHKMLAWWADGTLQLHRKALEGMGIDGWGHDEEHKFQREAVPVLRQATKRVPPLFETKQAGQLQPNHLPSREHIAWNSLELTPMPRNADDGNVKDGWRKLPQYDLE